MFPGKGAPQEAPPFYPGGSQQKNAPAILLPVSRFMRCYRRLILRNHALQRIRGTRALCHRDVHGTHGEQVRSPYHARWR